MKKLFVILITLITLISSLSLSSFAYATYVEPNPQTTVPYASPAINASINASEGWSSRVELSDKTCGHFWAHNPMTTKADLYYAYDNNGFYIAANITEGLKGTDLSGNDVTGINSFVYSTGLDDIDRDTYTGENEYGWNGDVMGIMIDPLGALQCEGFLGNSDYSAWYMVGLFQGNKVRIYKSHTSYDNEITDKLKAAGCKTNTGWYFEIMIPWDIIINDTNDSSMGMISIDKEMLLKEGSYMRVGAIYHDRFIDKESGETTTWGKFCVVNKSSVNGVGDNIASYGIDLTLAANPNQAKPSTSPTQQNTTPPTQSPTTTSPSPKPSSSSTASQNKPQTTPQAANSEVAEPDLTSEEPESVYETDEKGNVITDDSGEKKLATLKNDGPADLSLSDEETYIDSDLLEYYAENEPESETDTETDLTSSTDNNGPSDSSDNSEAKRIIIISCTAVIIAGSGIVIALIVIRSIKKENNKE